jgi:hypothetical protein
VYLGPQRSFLCRTGPGSGGEYGLTLADLYGVCHLTTGALIGIDSAALAAAGFTNVARWMKAVTQQHAQLAPHFKATHAQFQELVATRKPFWSKCVAL